MLQRNFTFETKFIKTCEILLYLIFLFSKISWKFFITWRKKLFLLVLFRVVLSVFKREILMAEITRRIFPLNWVQGHHLNVLCVQCEFVSTQNFTTHLHRFIELHTWYPHIMVNKNVFLKNKIVWTIKPCNKNWKSLVIKVDVLWDYLEIFKFKIS